MGRFLLKRLGLALLTLTLVSIILFAVAQVLPGDVGRAILGPYAAEEQVVALDHQLGVDRPLLIRYWDWISGFVVGDWGTSYLLDVPVASITLERLRNSVILGGFALCLIVPISILFGVLAALNYRRWFDRIMAVIALSLIALPEFVSGVIVLVIFAVKLGWLPVAAHLPSADPLDWFRQLLLPSIPLMFVLFGYISRMARAGTVDSLRSNYVRTAILKGLPRWTVIRRHVLRNSLLPTITVISVQTGYLVGGLVVTETLFNYPGIGKLIFDSAIGHDLPVLQATVLLIALLYMVLTLAADVVYTVLNPRIRLSSRS
ncbi:MAG TPA: ABC transporter permease [Stellaceae bacterium]|nr:ABC transporter permease [Stellaceae bacterium]